MNTLGKTKDTNTEEIYRQFIINCLGENDRRKYFLVTSFGEDFNVPEDTRALISESNNKDIKFVIGFLNKVKIDTLNYGDKVIFSTSEDGTEIESQIVLKNTGDIEINNGISGNATVLIKADGTMEFNGNADFITGFTKLKEGFDQLKADFNSLVSVYNSHVHPGVTSGGASTSATPSSGSSSSASIDDSKKDNLKIE